MWDTFVETFPPVIYTLLKVRSHDNPFSLFESSVITNFCMCCNPLMFMQVRTSLNPLVLERQKEKPVQFTNDKREKLYRPRWCHSIMHRENSWARSGLPAEKSCNCRFVVYCSSQLWIRDIASTRKENLPEHMKDLHAAERVFRLIKGLVTDPSHSANITIFERLRFLLSEWR